MSDLHQHYVDYYQQSLTLIALANKEQIMPVIVVANPKGGVGKSTLATNLAGYFTFQGYNVMLGDVDVQQSSRSWLALRSEALPPISAWEIIDGHIAKPPKGTTHMVLDTPAGLHGEQLTKVLKIADKVIVPLQASMFDILATQEFLQKLKDQHGKQQIGVLGMRVNSRTRAAEQLSHYVNSLGLPVLGFFARHAKLYSARRTRYDAMGRRTVKGGKGYRAVARIDQLG